jgi:tetratricopeptide (TPR) repeat protein
VRDQQMAKLGPAHSSTVATLHDLGDSYQLAGRYSEAIPLFEQVRDQQIAKLGPDHPTTLSTLVDLAVTLRQAGKLPEALQIWDEMMPRARRVLGPTHATIVTYNHNWCITLDAARKFGRAAEIRRESVAIQRQRMPADLPQLAGALGQLGQSLIRVEQFAEAEQALTECLAIRAKSQPDSWLTFHTKTLLGESLTGQKMHADAEALLRAGYEGMKHREASIPVSVRAFHLTEALQRLIDLYTAWDKPDDAAKWRSELNKLQPPGKPAAEASVQPPEIP